MEPRDRRPVPATRSTALPSLSTVIARREPRILQPVAVVGVTGAALAAGIALVPTHAPVCGPDRGAEISAHGHTVLTDAEGGHPLDALAELAVAMGWRAHTSATTGGIMAPGAISAVNTVPPVPVVPDLQRTPMGAPPPVTEMPPTRPAVRHGHSRRAAPTAAVSHGDRTVPAAGDGHGPASGGT